MINIAALSLYMLVTSVSGNSHAVTVPQNIDTPPILLENQKEESTNEVDKTVEAHVREYFSDIPVMIRIAGCESHFSHTGKNGKIIRGIANPDDVGVMQINEQYHLEQSKKLGYDIYTLEGNMAYGRYLYEQFGARPWLASSACWSKNQDLAQKDVNVETNG